MWNDAGGLIKRLAVCAVSLSGIYFGKESGSAYKLPFLDDCCDGLCFLFGFCKVEALGNECYNSFCLEYAVFFVCTGLTEES